MRVFSTLRILRLMIVSIGLSGFLADAIAQEVPSISAADLKKSPQKYWAGFFVFEDTLEEVPGDSTICIDDAEYTAFRTKTIGTIYAEPPVVDALRALETGKPYLFAGTVNQKSGFFFGLLGGGKFVVIVRDVNQPKQDTINITGRIPELELLLSTNRVNQTFARLDEIFKDVQKDMMGFANSQGIPLQEVFSGTHRDKVASSVRSALRRFEDKNRGNSQEFFVDVITSMLAVQHGYGEARQDRYEPAEITPAEPVALEEAAAQEEPPAVEAYPDIGSAEEWDINEVIKEIEEPGKKGTETVPEPSDASPPGQDQTAPAEAAAPADAAAPNNPD